MISVLPSQRSKGKLLPHWKDLEESHLSQEPSDLGIPKDRDDRLSVWKASGDHEESQDFWKSNLNSSEFEALRCHTANCDESETTCKDSSTYAKFYPKHGHFACKACGLALFSAESKVKPGNGKPQKCVPNFGCTVDNHVYLVDNEHQEEGQGHTKRVKGPLETQCARCRSHLGHVEVDRMPTRQKPDLFFRERHVVNGLSIAYVKEDVDTDAVYDRAVVMHHPSVIFRNHIPLQLFE
mmetsp:Transcript_3239/g.8161  ORF Transcript_3239/g.8161 Transcript_3239/m.8161 type:complete len:238 (+) Transcript_3239:76-789(+)|eukprot:CAMPEP_0168785484 /NCGR_PEP_ID=MMETSP0725-20121227/10775_1 /TAXON_ID=265536 /ORGANISM="Amphiprora sp., Strain CCMP467" /LENGTH=237 /DNA_ID=CAMNT_0008835593 /DNA_START=47 /DNA_END=760 /DNA_ORIENTATION=+